ncbi:FhaA domain-containing protein [Aeromicrobium sp.]|uniref:FhaA domain-containing protein n=1 Tax=Aeromicrobium sp. TaxID=1871063 RepID=UPI003D6C593D
MAGVLQRFEQRLETAVTGAFARAFRSAVQPVEIAAALQREVDNSAHILSRDRMLVPNDFTVELSQPDHERLSQFSDTLSTELARLVDEHVREQRYTLAGPLSISFSESSDLSTGRFRVRSRTNASVTPVSGQRMTETTIRSSDVLLEINGMQHPLTPPGVVIGRGKEAQLRIDDPGISRQHAKISLKESEGGTIVTVSDLGSTNGVILNGNRVDSAPVRDGSEILLGNTSVVIRIAAQAADQNSDGA